MLNYFYFIWHFILELLKMIFLASDTENKTIAIHFVVAKKAGFEKTADKYYCRTALVTFPYR